MKKLMDYRAPLYLTIDEYAKHLGVTVQTLYAIQKGHKPRPNTMRRIAEKLGVHPSEVVEFALEQEDPTESEQAP